MSTTRARTSAETIHRLNQFRRDDGRFGAQPPQPEAVFDPADVTDDFDVDFVDQCRLCREWVDYCRGHGDWNSYDTSAAADVRAGDRMWWDGADQGVVVAVAETSDGHRVMFSGGGTVTVPAGTDDVPVLPAAVPAEDMPAVNIRVGDRVLVADTFRTVAASRLAGASGHEFTFDDGTAATIRHDAFAVVLPAGPNREALEALLGSSGLVDDLEAVSRASDELAMFAADGTYERVPFQTVMRDLAWKAGVGAEADRLRAWAKTQISSCMTCLQSWHVAAAPDGPGCPYCNAADRGPWALTGAPWRIGNETLYDLDDAPAMERNRLAAARGEWKVRQVWRPSDEGGPSIQLTKGQ